MVDRARAPRHRTQLLLEQEQYQALERLAAVEQRSLSSLVREFVDDGLAAVERRRERQLAVLDRLGAVRRDLHQRFGEVGEDPVAASRRQRDQQTARVVLSSEPD